MRRRSSDILSDAGGFTLVEMLIAAALSMIVIGAGVMAFTTAIDSQPRITTKADAIEQGRVTMERMIRELRQSSGIVAGTSPSPSSVSVVTYVDSTCTGATASTATQCSVTYRCGTPTGTCTRQVAQPTGGTPAGPVVQVVSGLSNSSAVFTYSPSGLTPTYVGVTLAFPASSGGDAIALSDGAAFRNAGAPE
jgi:Tfp pilus assembly protein PilW